MSLTAEEYAVRANQVAALVTRTERVRVVDVRNASKTFGTTNDVFEVEDREGVLYIVRTNNNPEIMRHTPRATEALAGQGIRVPRVLNYEFDLSNEPFAWMTTEKIPGDDLRYALDSFTEQEMIDFAKDMANAQRQAARIQVDGQFYGFGPMFIPTKFDSWSGALMEEFQRRYVTGPSIEIRRAEQTLRDCFFELDEELAEIAPVIFMSDAGTKNVLAYLQLLSGIVDHDKSGRGDVGWTVAVVQTNIVREHSKRAGLYGQALAEHTDLTEASLACLPLYRMVNTLIYLAKNTHDRPPYYKPDQFNRMKRLFDADAQLILGKSVADGFVQAIS